MKTTVYAQFDSRELVELTLCRRETTELEVELAQRLDVALDMLEESECYDAGRQSQERRQA